VPLVVDSILRCKLVTIDSRFPGDRYLNVLHYRCSVGSLGETDFGLIAEQFQSVVWERLLTCLLTTTSALEFRMSVIWEAAGYEVVYDATAWSAGGLTAVSTTPPQASACITRRTFKPGRHGIGRFYFGPLAEAYCNNGNMLVDPSLAPDATVVLDALGDPLSPAGCTLKPCVTPAAVTANPTSNADVRAQAFAQKLTYLKSRRAGVGT